MDNVTIETLKSVWIASVVLIFIKDLVVVYLSKPNSPNIWNKKPVVFSTTPHMGSIDGIIVPVQRMFPNCGKYPKGCLPKTGCKAVPNTIDSTLHLPTQTTYTLETRKHIKPPKGFEGW